MRNIPTRDEQHETDCECQQEQRIVEAQMFCWRYHDGTKRKRIELEASSSRQQRVELSRRGLCRNAGSKTADNVDRLHSRQSTWAQVQREPNVQALGLWLRPPQPLRQNADDRVQAAVERDLSADHIGPSAEARSPEPFAQ